MKNSNLLNRLLSYSHEKQSPQRFGRYAAMLIMLLTLGVGQMWAWFTISSTEDIYFDAVDQYTRWSLSSNNLYVKVYYGNDQSSNNVYQMTKISGTKLYYCGSAKGHSNVSGIEFFAGANSSTYSYGTGKIKFDGWSNALDRLDRMCYTNSTSTNWSWSGHINNPPLSTISLAKYSTTTYGGDGSVGNPYLVAVGTTAQVQVSSTKRSSNLMAKYKFTVNESTDASYTTTTTKTVVASAVSGTTYAASVQGWGYSNSSYSRNALTSNTVYFQGVNIYSVTYNANGAGSGSVPAVSGTFYARGKNVTLANNTGSLAKTGYSLTGWNTEADGSGDHYALGGTYSSISSDVELYAEWTPDWALYNLSTKLADFTKVNDYEYTLSYELNETTHTNLQFKKNGTTGYVPGADDPTSTFRAIVVSGGYFSWGVVNGVTTGSYIITIKSTDSGSSWSYKAEQKYILTYDANGATSGSAPTDANSPYAPNTAVTTANSSMTKSSFTLTGWNTQANGQGTHYNLNTSNAFNINSNMTLYAEWTPDVPSSACVAGDFGRATMTKTTAGSVTTFTYTFYDKAAGTYNFYLDNCSGSAVLKATTGITMSQTGCTSIANSEDGNNKFRVVAGSAGDFTITATYNTSTKTINMDVTRVDIDAVASPNWYMIGGGPFGDNWATNNHTYPLNRRYRGINSVTYRVVDFDGSTSTYFRPLNSSTPYGQNSGSDQVVATGTQYPIISNQTANGTAFKTNGQGIVWCIVDNTNKKFWVQSPTTYYTITLANGTSGNTNNGVVGTEGTITLTENLYGKLQTKQFASGDRVNISVTAQTGYVIDDITIGATSVATDVNSSSYSGYTTMPSGNATLTVTYKHNYVVTFGVGTLYTSMGSVNNNISHTSGNRIIEGTAITFTATPALGYKFVGWYREAACSNQVSTSNPYATTITGTTTLYAKFDYRPLYIHADWLDWGTAPMTQSEVNRAVYTYEIDPLAAKSGTPSEASGGHHFHFVNTVENPNDHKAYNYKGVQTPTGSGFLTNEDIHLTHEDNATIQFDLTHKSKITITLTLQSVDDATKPTVNVAADRYYDIEYTTPSHGSYTIQVGSAGAVSADTEARAGTTITLANSPATGYHFDSWTVEKSEGTVSVSNNQFSMPAEDVTVSASFEATSYDVELNANGGTGAGVTVSATYDAEMPDSDTSSDALVAPTKTGYDFTGYWDATSSGSQYYEDDLSSAKNWDKATNSTLYAQWSAKSYTVTLDVDEANKGTIAGADGSASVTFDAAPSTIANRPTAANGYALDGYYTDHDGEGLKVINGDGTWIASVTGYTDGDQKWKHDGDVTLYAYYKKAEITNLVAAPGVIAPGETITVTPTIDPTPVGPTIVCWQVQYSNGTPLPSQPTFTPGAGNAVSFPVPSASATYIIQAVLKTGSTCGSGTELSRRTTTFQVAGAHDVTVKYMCGDLTIKASEVLGEIRPLTWSEDITAPTITGYTFARWDAGDGVTIKDGSGGDKTTSTSSAIKIKAVYDGTLTAVYTKKKMIFFNNTLGWSDVYVYFYNSDKYWSGDYGSGANKEDKFDGDHKPYYEQEHGHMTQIEGTNIWYFDYEGEGYATRANVAFTEGNQHGYHWFNKTNVVRCSGHVKELQMFVPLTTKSFTKNECDYYNDGYWMNYPENTGYSLLIYNQKAKAGATKLYEIPFEFTEDFTMPMELVVDLEAGQTYGFEIKRADSKYYSNTGTMTANTTNWSMTTNQSSYCGLQTTAAGSYTFNFFYNGEYRIGVTYPVAINDYRIVYTDLATWSQGVHTASWNHPSGVITKNSSATEVKKDTVSFFWSYGSTPAIKYQKCTGTGTGSVSWNAGTSIDVSSFSSVLTKTGVYNFIFEQPAGGASIALINVEPYKGDYYIRTDCAGSTKWSNFRSLDHQMTYSDYAEEHSGYSHYYAHWVISGTNVKFVIANDYSMCITDTLTQDYETTIADIDSYGYLNSGNASIRFMWDQATNKISRAYISGSTNISDRFLVLEGDAKMYDENGNPLNITGLNANEINLVDDQNFVYEREIQVNTKARAKLTAKYNTNIQYFKGSEGAFAEGTTIELLGGDADGKHTMRIVYDFKTNRLVTAYVPSGTIDAAIAINADLMIVREHQGAGQQLLFEGYGALSEVHTVYGVMRFNRWTLNNKEKTGGHSPVGDPKSIYERSLYWISFPFDVKLSDVFGFGTYGVDWIIEYYDGAERATNGYWVDSDGFWKMVMPAQRANFTLEAGKGYVLAIDVDAMKDNNTTFWANNIEQVELFFPSAANVENITQTTAHTTVPEHECTIDRRTDKSVNNINKDRTKADSHWNMIGIPSYANYGATLTSDEDGTQTITWNSNPYTNDLPFLYEWNMTDDSYTVQSGTTYPFKAMHAYMVQYHGDLYWSLASATPTPSPIVARRAYAEKPQNAEFRLELQQNEKMVDQTFVNMKDAEEISAGFKFDEDLCKEFNAGKANIYTLIENYLPAAGNTLPMSEQTTLVPVGVKIAADGEYTFAIPEGTEGIGVVLIDNIAGTRTNLALSDYTVSLGKGDLSDRFMLEIAPIKQMPTGIDAVSDQHSAVRKMMIDGILYIVKEGKIFDAQGKRLQ